MSVDTDLGDKLRTRSLHFQQMFVDTGKEKSILGMS